MSTPTQVEAGAGGPAAIPSEAAGFAGAWMRADPAALEFWSRHPHRDEDWTERLRAAGETPPARTVWERAARDGERLGADAAARSGIEALASGKALCVTTGQQPGLFLGPLYSVWKAMTVVALAARLEARTGRKTVPVFWSAADDSDFGEVGRAFFPGEAFRLTRHALEGGDLPAGGLVGDLGTEGTRRELEGLKVDWAGRARGAELIGHLERGLDRAGDHGELTLALLYDLFRGTGLVVVDGRWPELRREAAPLFRRWAERREEVGEAIIERGRQLEAAGFPARIAETSARRGLFELRDARRVPFAGSGAELLERIANDPETLSPNVTLRPLVQDSLFPNVATIGGPGEIAYHAQLATAYGLLGVDPPVLVPRYEATLLL